MRGERRGKDGGWGEIEKDKALVKSMCVYASLAMQSHAFCWALSEGHVLRNLL